MQANCLVFPSPKSHTISQIREKIILVPRNPLDNNHLLYSSLDNLTTASPFDQFADLLKMVEDNCTSRTQQTTQRERQKAKVENETTRYNGQMEGSLKIGESVDGQQYIPCLFLSGARDKLMVFFHANGQDISSAYEFLKMINHETRYPILAMQYRGYSIFKGETNPQNIQQDAQRLMQFLLAKKFATNQIILFGRSIGCAVALTVTQKYSVYCTVLLSPFLSLKKVATDLYCNCAGSMLKEVFDNQQNCRKIQCPLLIIHGAKDTLVPFEHSLKLLSGCQSYCRLKIIENMTHTKFNFRMDFIRHLSRFLADLD